MPNPSPRVLPFDPAAAVLEELARWNACENALLQERAPGEPPARVEDTVRALRAAPEFVRTRFFAAWEGSPPRCAGIARVVIPQASPHPPVALFHLGVLPGRRRRGLGRRLLACVLGAARSAGCGSLVTAADSRVPGGEAFARRVGGAPGQIHDTLELDLADIDSELLRHWQERAPGFELGVWEGPYPEDALPAVAALKRALGHTGPPGVQGWDWTPERLRQAEAALAAAGTQRWTLCAREPRSGALAGATDALWNPARPEVVEQGGTVVLPEYRKRGLGGRLKAAMLRKVLDDRPQARRVTTATARGNVPIERLNAALGFTVSHSWTLWRLDLARVEAYLVSRQEVEEDGQQGIDGEQL